MKTIILYTSKHGATRQVAEYISKCFDSDLCNLLNEEPPTLSDYDLVIIGGPVYLGTIHSKMREYLDQNMDTIISKQLALFLVCLKDQEVAAEQFNAAFDNKLLNHSLTDGFFGGEIAKKDLSLTEKFITFISFDKNSLQRTINYSEIDRFIHHVKENING